MDDSSDKAEGGKKWGALTGELTPLKDEVYQDREAAQIPDERQFTDDTMVDESVGGEADHSDAGSASDGGSSHTSGSRTFPQHVVASTIVYGGVRMSGSSVSEDDDVQRVSRRRRKKPNLPTPSRPRQEQGLQSDSSKQKQLAASSSTDSSQKGEGSSERRPDSSKSQQQQQPQQLSTSSSTTSSNRIRDISASSRSLNISGRRRFFASSKSIELPEGSSEELGGDDLDNSVPERMVEKVDPTSTTTEPTTPREYAFVISVGILLAFNMGFINGACLSGFLIHGHRQGVAGYTNPYTDSALSLAGGDYYDSKFQTCMIACFIGGSFISGAVTPNAVPYRIEPTYGPSFLASALCLGVATILAATTDHNPDFVFYLAGAASGIQNGISSSYTAKLIRSTGLTGTSTDIGLYLGQVVRGNKQNRPKLLVLILLATAFWCGGLISFYVTRHLTSLAFLFSTALFLLIGLSLMIFLVKKLNISFRAAMFGTWQWQVAIEKIHGAFSEILDMSGSHLGGMSDRELEEIFDRIDTDKSGTIDSEELYILLRSTGVKISRAESDAMLRFADKDRDGVLSREEWKAAIHAALSPKESMVVAKTKKLYSSTRNLVASSRSLSKRKDSRGSSTFSFASLPKSRKSAAREKKVCDSATSANEVWSQHMAGNSLSLGISLNSEASAQAPSSELVESNSNSRSVSRFSDEHAAEQIAEGSEQSSRVGENISLQNITEV